MNNEEREREAFDPEIEKMVSHRMRVSVADLATLRMLADAGLAWAADGGNFGTAKRVVGARGPFAYNSPDGTMCAEDSAEARLICDEHNREILATYKFARANHPAQDGDVVIGHSYASIHGGCAVLHRRCPKCHDNLIHNGTGIECGARGCDYAEGGEPYVRSKAALP